VAANGLRGSPSRSTSLVKLPPLARVVSSILSLASTMGMGGGAAALPLTGAYVLLKPFRVLVSVKVPLDSTDSLIDLYSSAGSRLAMKSSGGFVALVPLAE